MEERYLLLLHQDLESLLRLLSLRLLVHPSQARTIVSATGEPIEVHLRPHGTTSSVPTTTVSLFSNQHRTTNKAFERSLIEPLHLLVAAEHTVNVNGAQFNEEEVESLKSIMACPVGWAIPKRWAFYKALISVKLLFDGELSKENVELNEVLYIASFLSLWFCYNDPDVLPAPDYECPVDKLILATFMDMLATLY
jgi:hypothetical protein